MVALNIVSQIKSEYISGNGSIRELAEKYGQPSRSLRVKAVNEGWKKQRDQFLNNIEQRSMKKAETEVESWLEEQKSTCISEWRMITESIKGLNTSGQGVDADSIATYSRARVNYNQMIRQSLGLVDPSLKVDVTTGGKTIGDSIIEAIAKIRSNPQDTPRLTDEEFARVVDCEIVD